LRVQRGRRGGRERGEGEEGRETGKEREREKGGEGSRAKPLQCCKFSALFERFRYGLESVHDWSVAPCVTTATTLLLASDDPHSPAAANRRVADQAECADHARDLLVAREGGCLNAAADLSLHLDADRRSDAAAGAAAAAEKVLPRLAAELTLEAAARVTGHAAQTPVGHEAAVVEATARVDDGDRVVVERISVSLAHSDSTRCGLPEREGRCGGTPSAPITRVEAAGAKMA